MPGTRSSAPDPQGSGAPRRGGWLREGFDYDFSRVDPASGAHVDPPWCAIYETALVFDEASRPGPMLVDRWRVDNDLLRWRPGPARAPASTTARRVTPARSPPPSTCTAIPRSRP